jgi:small subunit ribosomal protein S5
LITSSEIDVTQLASQRQTLGEDSPFEEQVVKIYRCSTVVKGGRRFSFAALVVVGDRKGQVGIGYGKANEVPPAVEKAIKDARKSVIKVNLFGTSIPHETSAKYCATKVVLIPASEGTGVIAGSATRAVLELAGVHNVLTKVFGSTSAKNVVRATLSALKSLCSREVVEKLRGVNIQT